MLGGFHTQVQSVLSPITAVIMFIVSVFSPGVRNNPEKPIKSADTRKILTVFSRTPNLSSMSGVRIIKASEPRDFPGLRTCLV